MEEGGGDELEGACKEGSRSSFEISEVGKFFEGGKSNTLEILAPDGVDTHGHPLSCSTGLPCVQDAGTHSVASAKKEMA